METGGLDDDHQMKDVVTRMMLADSGSVRPPARVMMSIETPGG
jgi:hypothetical protein